ncbi:MAG: T9SS type A sorting domain-containing protein, partial [Bacteroidota bacterium]|nr:T9SS type A sorting domain-containing protein [Bacteroidota bacterium]
GTAYSWSTNESTQSITVSPTVTTTYFVSVSSATGCSNMDTVIVTVNSLPPVIVSNNDTICLGKSTTLTASGGSYYQWSTGSRLTSITVSPTTTTTYKVTVRTSVFSSVVKQIVVTVETFTPDAGPDKIICKGASTTLTATGGSTYSWNTGASTASITVSPTVLKLYTVTISMTGCSGTDVAVVRVTSAPTINAGSDKTICKGSSVTINTTSSSANSYTWNSGQSTSSITVTPVVTSTYTVTANSITGCNAVASVKITLIAQPVINAGADQTICMGTIATLTVSGGDSYQWSTNSRNTSISVNPVNTTTYTVTGTSYTTGCAKIDTVIVFVNNCKSLNDVPNGEEYTENSTIPFSFNVCPNPSNGIYKIDINNGNKPISASLCIYNVLGEKVFEKAIKSDAGIYNSQIDIQNLPVGIYNAILSNGDNKTIKNLIKN